MALLRNQHHCQLGNLLWKVAALFTKDIYPAGEFPYLGLTGSEEAGKITAGTTFLDWDAAARGCGPHGQAGVFEHSPALSGVHRARLGTALEQGRLRGALLGERAAPATWE